MTVLVPRRRILRPQLLIPRLNFRRLGDPSFNRLGIRGQPWGLGRAAAAAAAAPAFAPDDLSNLVAWYDANALTGFSDNDPVGTWDDESGNGYDLTEGTNQPTYQTGVVNSKPIVRFNGSNDQLSNQSFPDFGDNYTVFAIVAYFDEAPGDWTVFEVSNADIANRGFALSHEDTPQASWGARDTGNNRRIFGDDLSDGVFRIHFANVDAGNGMDYRVDAVDQGTSVYTISNPNTLDRIWVGRLASGSWRMKGDIAEIIIYSDTKLGGDITSLETYASTKYNISI